MFHILTINTRVREVEGRWEEACVLENQFRTKAGSNVQREHGHIRINF